jgi:EF hand
MHKRVLVLTTSALILAYGAFSATAQDRMTPQPDQQYTQHHPTGQVGAGTSGQQGGMMGPGTMGMMGRGMMGGGMMGSAMGHSIMMRMIFSLMDSDGDGTISLQEFQAAHERIFKGMDSNKDGRLTEEEMQAFMQGTRRSPQ